MGPRADRGHPDPLLNNNTNLKVKQSYPHQKYVLFFQTTRRKL